MQMKTTPQRSVFETAAVLLLFASAIGCVEEFETDSIKFEQLLVVDGNISDHTGSHQISLSYTTPINTNNNGQYEPASGALVWLEDDLNNKIEFSEASPGHYISPENFAGTIGRSYALHIQTSEGDKYQSQLQLLSAAPEISRIYHRFSIDYGDGEATAHPGAQFFLDVDRTEASSQLFRFEWNDAHEVTARYTKSLDSEVNPDGSYTIFPFNENVKVCYREDSFSNIILASALESTTGELPEVPIRFTPSYGLDVTSAYSIEATIRAITPEAYSYYRKIKVFNESNGSLFDQQQGAVVGNVFSTSNPKEKVLGYFEVSGAASKRIFMDVYDFSPEVLEHTFRTCSEFRLFENVGSLYAFYNALDIQDEDERQAAIIYRAHYEIFDYITANMMGHRYCVDCRYRGSLGKPDYWP